MPNSVIEQRLFFQRVTGPEADLFHRVLIVCGNACPTSEQSRRTCSSQGFKTLEICKTVRAENGLTRGGPIQRQPGVSSALTVRCAAPPVTRDVEHGRPAHSGVTVLIRSQSGMPRNKHQRSALRCESLWMPTILALMSLLSA